MNVLLVYYHPVVFDLGITFQKLGHKVTVAINQEIKDNYGTGQSIIEQNRIKYKNNFEIIPLTAAVGLIKAKRYNLVGCDGVFQGDSLVMDICENAKVPYFNIQGYVSNIDELSNNILSLGWVLPITQYHKKYPSEFEKKYKDWKELYEKGKNSLKNICVFYPQCWEICTMTKDEYFSYPSKIKLLSLIHRFQECNEWNYKLFSQIKTIFPDTENLEGKPKEEVYIAIKNSSALLHLKFGDQPGGSLLESMFFGRPVITMRSFITTSMNQDLLIDNHNAIIADTVDELIDRLTKLSNKEIQSLGYFAKEQVYMLTDFYRQKYKLEKFIERCLS